MTSGTEIQPISKIRQVFYDVYADLPTTNVNEGDLAYATDLQILYRWTSGAWAAITTPACSSSGGYTGNDVVNRAIAHGLGVAPKIVFIIDSGGWFYRITDQEAKIYLMEPAVVNDYPVTAIDSTNFYVGSAGVLARSGNGGAKNYKWVAMG